MRLLAISALVLALSHCEAQTQWRRERNDFGNPILVLLSIWKLATQLPLMHLCRSMNAEHMGSATSYTTAQLVDG